MDVVEEERRVGKEAASQVTGALTDEHTDAHVDWQDPVIVKDVSMVYGGAHRAVSGYAHALPSASR